MAFLIALINIVAWALIPLTVRKSPASQIAGMGIGVSGTIPLSAGFQLVGNSLIGVLIFGEWPSATAKVIGFIALALVVVGIVLSSKSDDPPAVTPTRATSSSCWRRPSVSGSTPASRS